MVEINTKKFSIQKILNSRKSLQDLLNLGFKNQKLSYDISRIIRKINVKLKAFEISQKSIREQWLEDNKKINETKPKKEIKKGEEGFEKYQEELKAYNLKISEAQKDFTKKYQELTNQEEEIEFKKISFKDLSNGVEKVIQPGILVDLDWLISEEEENEATTEPTAKSVNENKTETAENKA